MDDKKALIDRAFFDRMRLAATHAEASMDAIDSTVNTRHRLQHNVFLS